VMLTYLDKLGLRGTEGVMEQARETEPVAAEDAQVNGREWFGEKVYDALSRYYMEMKAMLEQVEEELRTV
jgi:hypothetical protein